MKFEDLAIMTDVDLARIGVISFCMSYVVMYNLSINMWQFIIGLIVYVLSVVVMCTFNKLKKKITRRVNNK